MIGQFSGPYSPVRPAKKVDSVAKLFCDLSPTVLNFNFIASKNLKLFFFTLNYVLKSANGLKTISN